MRKPGAETDSIVPQSDETYADEHEKAEDICCESESDGLTCEHFWHHHHGNHGHSEHSENHGCPPGKVRAEDDNGNLEGDTSIAGDMSEQEEERACCEDAR